MALARSEYQAKQSRPNAGFIADVKDWITKIVSEANTENKNNQPPTEYRFCSKRHFCVKKGIFEAFEEDSLFGFMFFVVLVMRLVHQLSSSNNVGAEHFAEIKPVG